VINGKVTVEKKEEEVSEELATIRGGVKEGVSGGVR